MRKVGKILKLTKGKLFVIKLNRKISVGSYLYDSSKKRIGAVIDLIGPVNSPYCISKPLVEKPEKLIGINVYVKLERRRR
ncbi:H/ACA RNA-protein complex protein Gar1 [Candidatus Geothermarchaeota archaeon]|nr:MAG: H/ACA RNA-protein complex protein Gar1 [Candidatus Geothermarchaeota archaeon]